MNKDLIVVIFTATNQNDGSAAQGVVGTGYPIAEGLILTSRHVIQPKNFAPNRGLKICWYYFSQQGAGKDEWLEVARKEIVWIGEDELDAALIRCPWPKKADASGLGRLSDKKPQAHSVWQSSGFARATRAHPVSEPGKFRKPGEYSGTVEAMADQASHFEINVNSYPKEGDWGGASGMPVFVADVMMGIVRSVPANFEGKKLYAIPTWKLLQDPAFAQQLSDAQDTSAAKLPENCKIRQLTHLENALLKHSELASLFTELMPQFAATSEKNNTAAELLETFLNLSYAQGSELIYLAFKKTCENKNLALAKLIGEFTELWLPITYQYHHQVPAIQNQLRQPSSNVIEVPNKLPFLAEVLMAEVDEKLLKLELSARNVLVSSLDLGGFAELGLDEEGIEYQKQLNELLLCRFANAIDSRKFQGSLDGLVKAICKNNDSSGELQPSSDPKHLYQRLAKILASIQKLIGRRYFCCVGEAHHYDQDMFKNIQERYPSLVFLMENCSQEQAEHDADRYRELSRIIATAKGNRQYYEEIIKYA